MQSLISTSVLRPTSTAAGMSERYRWSFDSGLYILWNVPSAGLQTDRRARPRELALAESTLKKKARVEQKRHTFHWEMRQLHRNDMAESENPVHSDFRLYDQCIASMFAPSSDIPHPSSNHPHNYSQFPFRSYPVLSEPLKHKTL